MSYRPKEAKWDDDIDTSFRSKHADSLPYQAYDSQISRLCFACMENAVELDQIRCVTCHYKWARRMRGGKRLTKPFISSSNVKTIPKRPHIRTLTPTPPILLRSGIYAWKIVDCYYIGKAHNLDQRKTAYDRHLLTGWKENPDLTKFYREFGGEWLILEEGPFTPEKLIERETYWINHYYPHVMNRALPNGLTLEDRILPNVCTST